jgi:hypothetical protein
VRGKIAVVTTKDMVMLHTFSITARTLVGDSVAKLAADIQKKYFGQVVGIAFFSEEVAAPEDLTTDTYFGMTKIQIT